jgi:integrase
MLTGSYEKMDGNYGRWAVVREIDKAVLERAKDIFTDYKNRGVILNGSFNDNIWRLSDQTKSVGLIMIAFEETQNGAATDWLGCSLGRYADCVKAYIALNLGEISLFSLREIAKIFADIPKRRIEEVIDIPEYIAHVTGLLQIIPGGNAARDYVIEALEEKMAHNKNLSKGKQRNLADFNSYLKFNEIITEFWQSADKKQKLFYFPLYFWWNLTAILPLRPTEFLLTPRDCLDGGNVLTIRRTKLKGGFEKISYRVEDDYERKQYSINASLAGELRSYLKNTEKMRGTEIQTLFLQKPHFDYIGRKVYINNRYYTYGNLRTCLRYFYQEFVRPINAESEEINLGDTRHIAMANLIISGGSPTICRELAGHSDINISSRYYSNISNLVECATINRYRNSKSTGAEINGKSKFPITVRESWHRVSGGWCDEPAVKNGDIRECLKISDERGQIGNCNHCVHYWSDTPGIRIEFLDEKLGRRKVDDDSRYLIKMIEAVRKGIGYTEDIGAALLRLQRSSDHYSKCLWEKYINEDGSDISWQDQKN